jgi:(p)ppGpp synthase/HD superfamily hydrolase
MTQAVKTPYFIKRRVALVHYLVGKGYHKALKAMAFAEFYHQGVRKDNTTPEFQHMLEAALHIITLKDVLYEEDTITATLLHDVREDYNVSHQTIVQDFGSRVGDSVERLSKVIDGVKKSTEFYFSDLANDPIGSLAKGVDRINNFQSMPGVFSIEKQKKYLLEGETYFLPMLKDAQRRFPEQFMAYQNVRHHMKSQIYLIGHSLK